jgi:CheY-like chemotaxis protein
MDIQMPNKNGYEATREIAYCLMGSKFQLYLTAGIMIDEKEKCFESGTTTYQSQLRYQIWKSINQVVN